MPFSSLKEVSNTIFCMRADDLVRKRCRDREDYYADFRSYEKAVASAVEERDLFYVNEVVRLRMSKIV
ncbi:MAG: hypothetical protein J6A92_07570 [Lachnospiraceae bacterium]|nr:hypothetical protein [Lachnospiraceae bacterium]